MGMQISLNKNLLGWALNQGLAHWTTKKIKIVLCLNAYVKNEFAATGLQSLASQITDLQMYGI